MQTYLRPDLLEQAGVADLGDWGAAFTATTTTSRSGHRCFLSLWLRPLRCLHPAS